MQRPVRVLISGAGIAGLTLASWLSEFGFQPVIIEKSQRLRDEGYMIDFYGSGFDVAEKMGLRDALQARHYPIPTLAFVNRHGQREAILDIERFRKLLQFRHFNFMRGDLETVLYAYVKDRVPIHFGRSITRICQHPERVEVEFSDSTSAAYDLVVGADGFHSNVRRLIWNTEGTTEHFLGYYVACSILENTAGLNSNMLHDQQTFYSYVEPKKQVSIYPLSSNRLATFFAFKSEQRALADRVSQQAALEEAFRGMGWITQDLLKAVRETKGWYFDRVSQIKLDQWYQGRVVLVGDACQCLTLLAGQGASMAMAGAYLLATALRQAAGDHQVAFQTYQQALKPEIEQRQRQAAQFAASFVPESRWSIWLRNKFLKIAFLPGLRSLLLRQVGARSIIK